MATEPRPMDPERLDDVRERLSHTFIDSRLVAELLADRDYHEARVARLLDLLRGADNDFNDTADLAANLAEKHRQLRAEVVEKQERIEQIEAKINDLREDWHTAVAEGSRYIDERNAARAEVRRLRSRVRVEVSDLVRAGVTNAHVEAWLRENGWAPSPQEGGWSSLRGRSDMWRSSDQHDPRGVSIYERGLDPDTIRTIAEHFNRPGLDILDEMARLEVEP